MALAVLAMAWVAARQPALDRSVNTARAVTFGVIWFVVAISPTSNFFFLSGVILAERTLYLPTVGLAAATGRFEDASGSSDLVGQMLGAGALSITALGSIDY